MFLPFVKTMFLIEELDDSLRLVERDPRTEDWEHIYRDVLEGIFYPTHEQLNGYLFVTDDHVDNPWYKVSNGIPSMDVSLIEHAFKVRQSWEKIKLCLDKYLVQHEKNKYYYEDTNQINVLLRSIDSAKLIRYAYTIFVIKMSENNIPLEAYAVIRGSNGLKIKSIDSTK